MRSTSLVVVITLTLWAGARGVGGGSPGAAPATRPAGSSASQPAVAVRVPLASPASWPVAATEAEIQHTVRQLTHPSPARRRAARRQLAEWGPQALGQLRQAASGGDLEAALSARDLLAELDSAILVGARVRLEVSRNRIAWNEPITLTVHVHNPTAGPIRVPWPASPGVATSRPDEEDARQVGAMLDVADFLAVTGPAGERIDLRNESIRRSDAVREAVDLRACGTPPSHMVPAGESTGLDIPLFNRGWARYPLLAEGKHTISFSYQPLWQDESWTRDGFGLVQAEPVTVDVVQPAPEAIRQADRPLILQLQCSNGTLVAELHSTWDSPQWINLNVGGEPATHARVEWRVAIGDYGDAAWLWLPAEASGPVFEADRLHRLEPGETLVISRAEIATILRWIREAGQTVPAELKVKVRYVYLATAPELRERLALLAHAREVAIPTHLFAGSVTSEPIVVKDVDQ